MSGVQPAGHKIFSSCLGVFVYPACRSVVKIPLRGPVQFEDHFTGGCLRDSSLAREMLRCSPPKEDFTGPSHPLFSPRLWGTVFSLSAPVPLAPYNLDCFTVYALDTCPLTGYIRYIQRQIALLKLPGNSISTPYD